MVSTEKLERQTSNNKIKLTILVLLLVITAIPIIKFIFFTQNSQLYIDSLIKGSAFISINTQKGFLEIVSKILTLPPLRITFPELSMYITSVFVFFLTLIIVAKMLFNLKTKSGAMTKNINRELEGNLDKR